MTVSLPPDLAARLKYGLQQHQAGRIDAAEAAYRDVLAILPTQPDALHLAGVIAYQRGAAAEAAGLIGRAVAQRGDQPSYHINLALALAALGRLAEAEAAARIATQLDPNLAEGHATLGVLLKQAGHLAEAEPALRAAIRLQPGLVDGHNNLGNVLKELGRLPEAEASYRAALALRPGQPQILGNLAGVLALQERTAEAEQAYLAALAGGAETAELRYGYGNLLFFRGAIAEAEAAFRRALLLDPGHDKARYNLGHLLLLQGRLEEGWQHFEARGAVHGAGQRGLTAPLWTGEALGDRVLLVHAEQGLGDTLQFCRYIPRLAQRGRIVFEVQPPLYRLIAAMGWPVEIVARGEALPRFDLHCPLLSLPRIFGTTLETIPAEIPYLHADPAPWRERLAPLDGRKIGLVWAGGPGWRSDYGAEGPMDSRRSIALDQLAPLAQIPGTCFISLQKGAPAAQAANPPAGMVLHDFTAELADFADTAALVAALDLVIGVDTAVPHLAGALGTPVWLLNRFDSCWRWLDGRDDSPWYPRLRQFRQPRPGDWTSVIAAVAAALSGGGAGAVQKRDLPAALDPAEAG